MSRRKLPLYDKLARLLGFVSERTILDMPNVMVVRGRRGHVQRAILIGNSVMRPLCQGNDGKAFHQGLDCGGKVWALEGVRGSNRCGS